MLKARVLVVGSANSDMTIQTEKLPAMGETVINGKFIKALGGKGANQAVAAARLGGEVTFICRLGADSLGEDCFRAYEKEGLQLDHLVWDEIEHSGVALIMIDQQGRNYLSVASGANMKLNRQDVAAASAAFERDADVLLLQLEVPDEANLMAANLAKANGLRVILNPAPFRPIPAALLKLVDILTPNEVELAGLMKALGITEARELLAVIPTLVITLGEQGARVVTQAGVNEIAAYPVNAVDTTAAGDAFNGALAVALARGETLEAAVTFANATAALSVTKLGAQTSLPTQDIVEKFIEFGENISAP